MNTPEGAEMKVDPIALQRLADSLNADLTKELDRCEAEGLNGSKKADELLSDLQGVAMLGAAMKPANSPAPTGEELFRFLTAQSPKAIPPAAELMSTE